MIKFLWVSKYDISITQKHEYWQEFIQIKLEVENYKQHFQFCKKLV